MRTYPSGFEENDTLRSEFIRDLTLHVLQSPASHDAGGLPFSKEVPRTLIQYWHDPSDLPNDVRDCIASWDSLADEGFQRRMFDDASAAAYIAEQFGSRERAAFESCRHPAMRSDYLRMCVILSEGGLYVDTDDVLVGEGLKDLFGDGRLKVQPLCYDIPTAGMVPTAEIWRTDLPTAERIFYVNNNPIAAPAGHPVMRSALARATDRLLGDEPYPAIQATTGPGNLTAALAAHAHDLIAVGAPLDFEILRDWETIAETRWHLSYRSDERNWRYMEAD